MNLFTVDITPDGRTQITFGNSPEAIQRLQPFLTGVLTLSCGVNPLAFESRALTQTPHEETESTRAKKRGRPKKKKNEITSLKLAEPNLTEYQYEWERQRTEITALYQKLRDCSNKFSGIVYADFGQKCERVWDYYYKIFEEKMRISLRKETMCYKKAGSSSKLNHILKIGKGEYFKAILTDAVREEGLE